MLSKRITDVPGASEVFSLGVVSYANVAKEQVLHVPEDLLKQYGAVSAQVARAMARGIRELARSGLGIGITGVAGPDGGTPQKPLGLVFIALAGEGFCHVREMKPTGRYLGRSFTRERAASHALDMVRRFLEGLPLDFQWR